MARLRPPDQPRHRGHEIFTVLIAFGVALLVGRILLAVVKGPPAIVTILVFVLAYVGAYVLFYRASRPYFRR